MAEICKGSLVYSRAGKDKGTLFVVLSVDGDYVYLSDGDTRRVENPKKKKLKHINKTNSVVSLDFDNLTNAAVRKALLMNKAEC
jgi:ribosomal protein L14E/L6E/L27E